MLSKPTELIRKRAADDARQVLCTDVEELRFTRFGIVQIMKRINEIAGHLEADPLYVEMQALQGSLPDRKAHERDIISAIRAMAVDAYEAGMCDGKKVVPGVSIRVSKRFKYDVAEALAWCAKDELMAKSCTEVVLKTKEYEAVASALGGPIEEVETASATIARDLDEVLGYGPPTQKPKPATIILFPPAGETKAEEELPF